MNVAALPFFRHITWEPDARELRRFAVAMLVGFSLVGLFSTWRSGGIATASIILWGVGLVLAFAAFIPHLNRLTYLAVYLPASIMGYVVSHVMLALMFFFVITPLGVVLRLMGKDLLQLGGNREQSRWNRVNGVKNEDSYYRQF